MLLHRGERGHGLEDRARRIRAEGRAVERRVVLQRGRLRRQPLIGELPHRDAAGEHRRLVRRRRREREDRAVRRVEGDDRAAVRRPLAVAVREADSVLERLLGGLLELQVEREAQRVPRLRQRRGDHGAARVVGRVHVQPLGAGDAAQVRVVARLDAGLADLVAGLVALLRLALQLARGDLADVAEHLRGERAIRVVPDVAPFDGHAGKLARVLGEVDDHRLARRVTHDDGRERIAGAPLDARRDLVQRHAGHVREPAQLGVAVVVDLRQVVGPQPHGFRGLVEDEHPPVPVEDRPSRRLDAHGAVRVRLRLVDVLRPGEHLQRPETQEERREDDEHDHAQNRDAQREPLRDAVRVDDRVARRQEPAPAAWPPAFCRRASQAAEPRSRGQSGRSAAAACARARRRGR